MSPEDDKSIEARELVFSWTGFAISILFSVLAHAYLIVFVLALGIEARWKEMSAIQIFFKNMRDSLEVLPLALWVFPFVALLYLPVTLIGIAFVNRLGCYSKKLAILLGVAAGVPATIITFGFSAGSNWATSFAAAGASIFVGATTGLLFRTIAVAKSPLSNKELSLT